MTDPISLESLCGEHTPHYWAKEGIRVPEYIWAGPAIPGLEKAVYIVSGRLICTWADGSQGTQGTVESHFLLYTAERSLIARLPGFQEAKEAFQTGENLPQGWTLNGSAQKVGRSLFRRVVHPLKERG